MAWGKVIGGLFGFNLGGVGLALLGILVGHLFDRAYIQLQRGFTPQNRQHIQDSFFRTVFTLLGHLAKADGRISQEEIQQTELLMQQMGLTADHKREAIKLFRQGAEPVFSPDAVLQEFRTVCGRNTDLSRMLLVYLISLALADGELDDTEQRVLRQVAQALGFSVAAFDQLLRMILAQDSFAHGGSAGSRADELEQAYVALGVKASASDAQVKKAYRKLMSEYHPDKLIGQGLPDDMIQAATERSQEVQAAYDSIKKSRK